jgi:hypothetical protein
VKNRAFHEQCNSIHLEHEFLRASEGYARLHTWEKAESRAVGVWTKGPEPSVPPPDILLDIPWLSSSIVILATKLPCDGPPCGRAEDFLFVGVGNIFPKTTLLAVERAIKAIPNTDARYTSSERAWGCIVVVMQIMCSSWSVY